MPEFTDYEDLTAYDLGVKGFERRFQSMIENYLNESGIDAPWWKYYSGSIFEDIWDIYKLEDEEQNYQILINLYNYYDEVTKEVARRVEENTPVTQQDRIATILAKHPERRDLLR